MSSVQELARRITQLERDVRVGQVAPQLGSSSLDDEAVNVYDQDGGLKARVGRQHDGTYTAAELDGPVPPVPSAPVAEGGPGSLTVSWDGTYAGDARAPLDFRLVEVYALPTPFSDRRVANLLGHYSNEAGGELTVARPPSDWHVGLVTKAESGRRSAVSPLDMATVTSILDQGLLDDLSRALEDLEIDLDALTLAFTTSEAAPTPTDGVGKPDGAYWTQIDVEGAQIARWRWDGTTWLDAPLGEVFIPELGVSKLVADQAGFATAVIELLITNQILTRNLILQSEEGGWVTETSGEGLRTFTPEGEAAIQLGRFDAALEEDNDVGLTLYESLPLLDDDGNPILDDDSVPMTSVVPVASMNDRGEIAGKDVSASESFTYRGDGLSDILWALPKGVVYNRNFPTQRQLTVRGGHSYIVLDTNPERLYNVTVRVRARNTSGRGVQLTVRDRVSNLDDPPLIPSATSGVVVENTTHWILPALAETAFQHYEFSFAYSPGGTVWKNTSILLCAEPVYPTGTADGALQIGPVWWTVEDMGPIGSEVIQSGGSYSESGGGSPGGGSQPPTETPKRTYTKTFGYEWHRSWEQGGARPSQIQNAAYQGYTKYYPSAGLYRSQVGIKSMTGALSGATIKKVQVRVRMDHSYSNAGGTVVIGTHNNNGRPGSWANYDVDIVRSKFSRGQEKWITMPSSTWQGFKDGTRRGICFYSASTSSTYYCQMAPGRVAVKITYEK